jgi:SAM-dependent methyltransferase
MDKCIEEVRAFWNTEACGTHFIESYRDEKDFFEQYRNFRYRTEWHIPLLVPFSEAINKRVLEIGCGNGADGVRFAEHGAIYTGVDLTERAIEASRRHFELLNLAGTFQVENAESLTFPDESFDMVYSYGVLHHTPNPAKAFQEVYRILKPGGKAIVMLYHKNSFNYYLRILTYMRLRVLLKSLTRIMAWKHDREELKKDHLKGIRGNRDPDVWQIHYENFLQMGWDYLRAENFVHHCTDGPECSYAYTYTRRDIKRLFSNYREIEFKVAHFPLRKYSFGGMIPVGVEKILASTIGWQLFIYAKK